MSYFEDIDSGLKKSRPGFDDMLDYVRENKINKIVKANLAKKIEKSTLKSNAKNRLISELSKILIVTNSMGWKLQYNGEIVNSDKEFGTQLKN